MGKAKGSLTKALHLTRYSLRLIAILLGLTTRPTPFRRIGTVDTGTALTLFATLVNLLAVALTGASSTHRGMCFHLFLLAL